MLILILLVLLRLFLGRFVFHRTLGAGHPLLRILRSRCLWPRGIHLGRIPVRGLLLRLHLRARLRLHARSARFDLLRFDPLSRRFMALHRFTDDARLRLFDRRLLFAWRTHGVLHGLGTRRVMLHGWLFDRRLLFAWRTHVALHGLGAWHVMLHAWLICSLSVCCILR